MIIGVVLAAGASRRMGSPKALARRGGTSFLARGIRHLWSACDDVVVVLGAHAVKIRREAEDEFERLIAAGRLHEDLTFAHRHGAAGLEVEFVVNRAWSRGMFGSARLGLTRALARRPEAVLVLPVDHPDVRVATVAVSPSMRSLAYVIFSPL